MNYGLPLLCTIILLLTGCSDEQARPSFILISLDTTRADHLGTYGYNRQTTPWLDTLAQQGIVFEDAITVTCHTLFSHASMLTGMFPGAMGFNDFNKAIPMNDAFRTMAEDFQEANYRTAGFTAHGVWLNEKKGFAQGFDHFSSGFRSADTVLSEAKTWLEQKGDDSPFFLFLHLFDVHSDEEGRPYQAAAPFEGRFTNDYEGQLKPWSSQPVNGSRFLCQVRDGEVQLSKEDLQYIRNQYDEGLAYTDDALGRFLETYSQLEDTYIIITADHGEEFQEHGGMLHSCSYDEVLKVPLIFVLPPNEADRGAGALQPQRITDQVSIIDLRPTLMALAGLPEPTLSQGANLLPWLMGEQKQCPSGPVLLNLNSAIRYKGFKFIRRENNEPPQLYELAVDPEEQDNIADRDPGAIHLSQVFHDMIEEQRKRNEALKNKCLDPTTETGDSGETEEELQVLRELGYL